MDDRRRAVEPDSRAQVNGPPPSDPSYNGGQGGWTGLEAIWNYPFWQGLSINGFDSIGHILRIGVQASPDCSPYINDAPENIPQAKIDACKAWLGPYQPGFNQPDPVGAGRRRAARAGRASPPASSASAAARVSPRPARCPARATPPSRRSRCRRSSRSCSSASSPTSAAACRSSRTCSRASAAACRGAGPELRRWRRAVDPNQLLDFLLAP